MAYNRDWDKGKDWSDQAYWPTDNRGHVRGREDEYYGDGKRRKYNNGVRVLSWVGCQSYIFHRDMMHSLTTKLMIPTTLNPTRTDTMTLPPTTQPTIDMARASMVKSAWSRANPVHMSFSWVWTPTSQRRMFVDTLYMSFDTKLNQSPCFSYRLTSPVTGATSRPLPS